MHHGMVIGLRHLLRHLLYLASWKQFGRSSSASAEEFSLFLLVPGCMNGDVDADREDCLLGARLEVGMAIDNIPWIASWVPGDAG